MNKKTEIESEICFAIMRHSNIGLRYILQGIPVINLHLAKIDKLVVHDYYRGYPLLYESFHSLSLALNDASKTIEDFFKFRNIFLNKVYPEEDICNYLENYD